MSMVADTLPITFNAARHFVERNVDLGRGARPAFFHGDEVLTYLDVFNGVKRAARLLSELGVERENRVAILLPDCPESVFAFWGALWMGAVPVPINVGYSIDDIRYILGDTRAKVLVTDEARAKKLGAGLPPSLRHVLHAGGAEPLRALLASRSADLAAADTCRDEAAFWLYTSGSTGRPKGVVHTHRSMVVCAELYGKQTIGLREDDVCYSVAKIPFAYGLGNTTYMPMSVGASAVLSDAENVFDVAADVRRHRPTVFFAIPATYAGLLAVADICPLDASSIRLCVSAAEQLPEAIWHRWKERHGLEVCEGIGTTELLHIFLSNRPGECRPGTCGKPVPGYRARIVDAEGREVPPGELGDLEIRGESLMIGYWNRHEETRQALFGGAMRTGDKYVAGADGFFRFMGRRDDLFKISGLWVSPMEVEDVLLEHSAVLVCAVLPERRAGEELPQVVAHVELRPEHATAAGVAEDIRRFARARMPHVKAPKVVRIVASLPRTVTGKVDRRALRGAASERIATNPGG